MTIENLLCSSDESTESSSGLETRMILGENKRMVLVQFFVLTLVLTRITDAYSGDRKPTKPTPKDKCPVCGMFVAKYPDFLAQILFKDGSYAIFDGTKDMFKYYYNLIK